MNRHFLHSPSTSVTLIIGSAVFYLLILCLVQPWSSRDPTSWFFDAETAYKPRYSVLRRQQSEAFLHHVVKSGSAQPKFDPHQSSDAICVGIATVARKNGEYFRTSMGSLLEGLSVQERKNIYLVPFFANSEPSVHPAYGETWLEELADQVLTYNQTDHDVYDHVLDMDNYDKEFKEKPLFDYVYLLNTCLSIGAPYIVMLEDDIVALDGWYHRTRNAIEAAEKQTALGYGTDKCKCDSSGAVRQRGIADLAIDSPLPTPFLHGKVPRLELGGMADISRHLRSHPARARDSSGNDQAPHSFDAEVFTI